MQKYLWPGDLIGEDEFAAVYRLEYRAKAEANQKERETILHNGGFPKPPVQDNPYVTVKKVKKSALKNESYANRVRKAIKWLEQTKEEMKTATQLMMMKHEAEGLHTLKTLLSESADGSTDTAEKRNTTAVAKEGKENEVALINSSSIENTVGCSYLLEYIESFEHQGDLYVVLEHVPKHQTLFNLIQSQRQCFHHHHSTSSLLPTASSSSEAAAALLLKTPSKGNVNTNKTVNSEHTGFISTITKTAVTTPPSSLFPASWRAEARLPHNKKDSKKEDAMKKSLLSDMEEVKVQADSLPQCNENQRLLFSGNEALLYIYQIVCGLCYLHDHFQVHRDLDPHSVMFQEESITPEEELEERRGGVVLNRRTMKLRDVDLRKALEPPRDAVPPFGGVWPWMAPELLKRGSAFSEASDMWALGCLVYELLTLHHPFGTPYTDPGQLVENILTARVVPLPAGVFAPPMDYHRPEVLQLMWEMLDPDPSRRPSARTVREKLENIPSFAAYLQEQAAERARRLANRLSTDRVHLSPDEATARLVMLTRRAYLESTERHCSTENNNRKVLSAMNGSTEEASLGEAVNTFNDNRAAAFSDASSTVVISSKDKKESLWDRAMNNNEAGEVFPGSPPRPPPEKTIPNPTAVRECVEDGAFVQHRCFSLHRSILHTIVDNGDVSTFALCLQTPRRLNFSHRASSGWSIIHFIVKQQDVKKAEEMLKLVLARLERTTKPKPPIKIIEPPRELYYHHCDKKTGGSSENNATFVLPPIAASSAGRSRVSSSLSPAAAAAEASISNRTPRERNSAVNANTALDPNLKEKEEEEDSSDVIDWEQRDEDGHDILSLAAISGTLHVVWPLLKEHVSIFSERIKKENKRHFKPFRLTMGVTRTSWEKIPEEDQIYFKRIEYYNFQ